MANLNVHLPLNWHPAYLEPALSQWAARMIETDLYETRSGRTPFKHTPNKDQDSRKSQHFREKNFSIIEGDNPI